LRVPGTALRALSLFSTRHPVQPPVRSMPWSLLSVTTLPAMRTRWQLLT
jgi:hypothetical protein